MVLKCPLQSLEGTAVELRSRLWNSTFIEVTRPNVLLFPCVSRVFGVIWYDCLTSAAVFLLFTQDYASLLHLHIVVRASLVLHSQAKNMILRTPDTDVSSSSSTLEYKGTGTSLHVVFSCYAALYVNYTTSRRQIFCPYPSCSEKTVYL